MYNFQIINTKTVRSSIADSKNIAGSTHKSPSDCSICPVVPGFYGLSHRRQSVLPSPSAHPVHTLFQFVAHVLRVRQAELGAFSSDSGHRWGHDLTTKNIYCNLLNDRRVILHLYTMLLLHKLEETYKLSTPGHITMRQPNGTKLVQNMLTTVNGHFSSVDAIWIVATVCTWLMEVVNELEVQPSSTTKTVSCQVIILRYVISNIQILAVAYPKWIRKIKGKLTK